MSLQIDSLNENGYGLGSACSIYFKRGQNSEPIFGVSQSLRNEVPFESEMLYPTTISGIMEGRDKECSSLEKLFGKVLGDKLGMNFGRKIVKPEGVGNFDRLA
ncbi:hypothetical protein KAI32_01445 [Candidatus Pacearchaeota archaeon]|nr:hypothetical protein [Candidatus Pacearchaeota archaeon]